MTTDSAATAAAVGSHDATSSLDALRETLGDRLPSLDDLRQMGNYQFSQGNYDHALTLYDLAVETARDEGNEDALVVNLNNRSAALFKMERFEDSQRDAQEAVSITKGRNAKACYRLAKTQIAMENHSAALETLTASLQNELSDATAGQRKALTDLSEECNRRLSGDGRTAKETSIKYVSRKVSIREFRVLKELGVGNFSEVHTCKHKETGEVFALKIITKKRAAELAKRQHPNVYNEIQMERRTLLERLPPHHNIVRMYHSFQDYNSLYYLMDLHTENTDLWRKIRYKDKMVGVHRSLIKIYLAQVLDALEHMHTHGIVHRDLKAENILMNENGHIIVIDFGTAKDLIEPDLNGPEFVGTPDFMAPEAVQGISAPDEIEKALEEGKIGADHTTDLWAFGALAFILHTGQTPFWSPSPYLTFLKIKRGHLYRPWGIADDDAWDFIQSLMQVDPSKRLGADCFELVVSNDKARCMTKNEGGYDVIRNHPYLNGTTSNKNTTGPDAVTPVPSLVDLCIPAVAELARKDARDPELCDRHPPGDGSSHDMLRLRLRDRKCVMHVLDRLQVVSQPFVYQRFFSSHVEFRLDKIRPETRDYVGLTRMNDNQGRFPMAVDPNDPNAKPIELDPIKFVHITNPLLVKDLNMGFDEETRKMWKKQLKKCIATINRSRPKLVVACGFVDDSCRKLLARISDSIPVVVHDGSTFFSFWLSGAQGLMLRSNDFLNDSRNDAPNGETGNSQMLWLREELEQSRMSKHQVFAFVDCDPRHLPELVKTKLARGKASCILGICGGTTFTDQVEYRAENVSDNASVRSTESEPDENDNHTTQILGTAENALRWITIEEHGQWQNEFYPVSV